jgi:hypothetical protein
VPAIFVGGDPKEIDIVSSKRAIENWREFS